MPVVAVWRRLLEFAGRYGESCFAVAVVVVPTQWPTGASPSPGHPERPAGHVPLAAEEVALWSQILSRRGGWLARTGPDTPVSGRLRTERRVDQG
ncbi:DUF6059 family protein [Kribbella sp. NPDC050124]|uniref:DUF6059 family protein n=1 Tax=Kribbella sp. NPDC050124 TaxID=3364114 RepID=UPI0037ACE374